MKKANLTQIENPLIDTVPDETLPKNLEPSAEEEPFIDQSGKIVYRGMNFGNRFIEYCKKVSQKRFFLGNKVLNLTKIENEDRDGMNGRSVNIFDENFIFEVSDCSKKAYFTSKNKSRDIFEAEIDCKGIRSFYINL